MGNKRVIYHALALLVVGIWGVTFICTKVLIAAGLNPAQIFFCRFILAYAGMWIVCLLQKGRPRLLAASLRDELVFVLLGITGGSFYFLTENTALKYSQACNVAFIVSITPLLTLLLSLAVKKFFPGRIASGLEDVRINPLLVGGTLLSLAGMAVVIFDGARLQISPKGDLLALGAGLCWATYSVLLGEIGARYGTVFTTRKVFFYGLVTILPFLMGDEGLDIMHLMTPTVIFNLVFLGVAASLLCFVIWNKVITELGNVTSTNYVYLNPFFTMVFAVILLHESMTVPSAIGSLAIVAGVFLAGRSGRQHSHRIETKSTEI